MKAFLAEEGREVVAELLAEVGPGATSRIAYVECQAAFARGKREGRLTPRELSSAIRQLDERWPNMVVIEIDGPLSHHAGRMVHEHTLRASDAIHLASGVSLGEGTSEEVVFACWDARLWEAASRLGFRTSPPTRPLVTER